MRKLTVLAVLLCLLLCGCGGLMDGSYVSVTPYEDRTQLDEQEFVEVSSYADLQNTLVRMVARGAESGMLSIESYSAADLDESMRNAIAYVLHTDPLGAYAVESIEYEQGSRGTIDAVAVTIEYNHNYTELRTIPAVEGMEAAISMITTSLSRYETDIVLKVNGYEKVDFAQLLQDYADTYPELVMEIPQVTTNTYPLNGENCVLEVNFTYQSNRESLRSMQDTVQDVFSSARLYVSGDGSDMEKYGQLHSFLTERYEYQIQTSITPAYSLLCHGVGDSRAFATIYAAFCYRVGLECLVVSGTRDGQPWFWNIIYDDGIYYHVDLIHGSNFQKMTDAQMTGYVWDYSAYPACGIAGQTVEEATEAAIG